MLTDVQIKSLEKFVEDKITTYASMNGKSPPTVFMSSDLYPHFSGLFAQNPFMHNTSIYFMGTIIQEGLSLPIKSLKIETELFTVDLTDSKYHNCHNHLMTYMGFTEIYDFCSICDQTFEAKLCKK